LSLPVSHRIITELQFSNFVWRFKKGCRSGISENLLLSVVRDGVTESASGQVASGGDDTAWATGN
jgi:hypothetical protein